MTSHSEVSTSPRDLPRRSRALPPRADRLLLPDARLGLRGRGRRPGDDGPGLAGRRRGSRAGPACRSWLYRIATNVCLDMLRGRQRRARPDGAGPVVARPIESHLGPMLPEATWVSPIADDRVMPPEARPGRDRRSTASRIRLAFVTALQHLPARQRAALILCEVLRWQATEVAELLGHQRGRGQQRPAAGPGHAGRAASDDRPPERRGRDADSRAARPVRRRLRALRHRPAGHAAARGRRPVDAAVRHVAPGRRRTSAAGWSSPGRAGAAGRACCPTCGQRLPAFGQYRPDPDGGHTPWALQVLEISGGRITGIYFFLDAEALFPAFGLPAHLPG